MVWYPRLMRAPVTSAVNVAGKVNLEGSEMRDEARLNEPQGMHIAGCVGCGAMRDRRQI